MALPGHEDTLCTLVCLNKAADKHSKEDCISMADIQTAAAEVHSGLSCTTSFGQPTCRSEHYPCWQPV